MQGNIACAEGALAAGCTFFAGYPITPSTEVAEHMADIMYISLSKVVCTAHCVFQQHLVQVLVRFV